MLDLTLVQPNQQLSQSRPKRPHVATFTNLAIVTKDQSALSSIDGINCGQSMTTTKKFTLPQGHTMPLMKTNKNPTNYEPSGFPSLQFASLA
jgi:hypothetical protein